MTRYSSAPPEEAQLFALWLFLITVTTTLSLTYSQQQVLQVATSFPFDAVLDITARELPVGVEHCGAHTQKIETNKN